MNIHAGLTSFENSPEGIFSNDQIILIFSGECYIGSEIASGDSLIGIYKKEGEKFIAKLNGLFCGLLIDKEQKKVFLFNDRYGIQRIYFHERGGIFYFASEAKALLRILPAQRHLDPEGVVDYLAFGCTLDWKTLFQGIGIVPGGSLWSLENGKLHKGKYFSPEDWESQLHLSADEFESRFQETFRTILPRYFKSSSKIGIALTGGLDTRMILAGCPQNNSHTTSYTFTGNNGQTLDDKIAARVAAATHLDHQLLRLDPDFFSDFASHADKTIYATDGCAAVSHTHEIYFNRKARQLAPVRLTGNYGSEILRDVSTFKQIPIAAELFDPYWGARINAKSAQLHAHKAQAMTFATFKEIPWNLFGNLAAGRSQLAFRTPYLDNELVALAFQAPEQIRKSSLPSSRFVQANNPALAQIPTDRGFAGKNKGLKFLSRRAFAEVTFKLDYYTTAGLPRPLSALNPIFKPIAKGLKIAGMHKFVRYSDWFRNELASYVREGLSRARNNGIWNPNFLERIVTEHIRGQRDYSTEINSVLTLETIERKLLSAGSAN
jgi:asparagine synthase (glutamine-hydrolysing)